MSVSKANVYDVLREHQALLVHFSGCPKGAGAEREDHLYPHDLQSVLDGKAHSGLSCSTVMPRDCFGGFDRNATGCVGALLGLQSGDSLKAVSAGDCGSALIAGVREIGLADTVTLDSVVRSISNRKPGHYNEWIVANYEVLGLFAAAPFEVSALCRMPAIPDAPVQSQEAELIAASRQTNIEEVANTFPGSTIVSFHNGRLVMWIDGRSREIAHSDLYCASAL